MNVLMLLVSPSFWLVVALISAIAAWPTYRRTLEEAAGQFKWLAAFIFFWTNATTAIAFSSFLTRGRFDGAPPLEAAITVLAIFISTEGTIIVGLVLWFWPGYRQVWRWVAGIGKRKLVVMGL